MLDVLRFMRPVNRLALEMEMRYGMRIGDLLSQEWAGGWAEVLAGDINYVDYKEQKTGKMRRIWPVKYDLLRLKEIKRGDNPFLFPARSGPGHRTRQAVWKDLHEVAKLYRIDGKKLARNVGTHSARKVYAVRLYTAAVAKGEPEPLSLVRKDLNHQDLSVTFLYAMADIIADAKYGGKM